MENLFFSFVSLIWETISEIINIYPAAIDMLDSVK